MRLASVAAKVDTSVAFVFLVAALTLAALPLLLWTLFGARIWRCPQCKEFGPFWGRCGICGHPHPGLSCCLEGVVFAFLLLAFLLLILRGPFGGRYDDDGDQGQPPPSAPAEKEGDLKE